MVFQDKSLEIEDHHDSRTNRPFRSRRCVQTYTDYHHGLSTFVMPSWPTVILLLDAYYLNLRALTLIPPPSPPFRLQSLRDIQGGRTRTFRSPLRLHREDHMVVYDGVDAEGP